MTNRLISVDDDFTLPPEVQVSDENLPAASNAAAVASKLDASQVGVAGGAAPLDGDSLVPDANLPTRLQTPGLDARYMRKGEIVLNAKDYGAKGDGVTDDALAIQGILDFAQTAPIRVLFPAGTYVVKQKLFAYSNTTLDLGGATILKSFNNSPGGVSLMKLADNTENLTIRNGILHGNGANFPGVAGAEGFDMIHGTGIKNGTFENLVFKDVVGAHSIDLNTIDGLTVSNCKFLGFTDPAGTSPYAEAIQLDPNGAGGGTNNKNVLITGCYFGPSTTPGFGAPFAGIGNHATLPGRIDSDIKITDNTFDGCAFAGVRAFRWDKVIIRGNTFIGGARGVHVTPYSGVAYTPESGSGYTIAGNTFTGCAAPILFANPTLGPGNIWSRFKNIAITGNAIDGGGDAISLGFVAQVAITGNTISNVTAGAIKLSYHDSVTISGNIGANIGTNFVWITESTEAALVGTGLTQSTTITGNTGTNIGYRAVHVNCAAKHTTIVGNTFVNVSTAAATRDGISADTGANGGTIEGNSILDGGATNKPVYGISITGSVVNFRIGANNVFGATKPVYNNGSGTSTLAGVFVTGTPEAVQWGKVGSTVVRTDGGALTTMYVKESGTGNTGWIAK